MLCDVSNTHQIAATRRPTMRYQTDICSVSTAPQHARRPIIREVSTAHREPESPYTRSVPGIA
eukprot:943854-Rhodomonas_salina.1